MTASICEGTFWDFYAVAERLRPQDRRELAVTRDVDDFFSLAMDAYDSFYSRIAFHEDKPALAFGAVEVNSSVAQVWAFGTADAVHVLRPVTRFIKRSMIPCLLSQGVREARAISHPDNHAAHRWLKFLGFTLKATIPGVGSRKEDMLLFRTSADVYRRNAVQLEFAAA